MKIKTKQATYRQILDLPKPPHKRPLRPSFLLATVVRIASIPSLLSTRFRVKRLNMQRAGKGPWLVLMNHSCFLDLKIASKILYPKPYGIVCTTDALVGKRLLMRLLGCIPTQKFVSDLSLIRDMMHLLHHKRVSVLMYPEAGYTFDGRSVPLPRKMGVLLKKLNVPVVMITTRGAFQRDPLYNGLQLRKVHVSATVECLLTPEEIAEHSVEELDEVLQNAFSFDQFRWQRENGVIVDESFRADGLERILYRCPHCNSEGTLKGKGTEIACSHCGIRYELTELGSLACKNGDGIFDHVPSWYDWQRQCVRAQIEQGDYRLDTAVKIGVMSDDKALYMIGDGRLVHDDTGFTLTGDGWSYTQPVTASHTVNSDFFWYEIGDVIGIGDRQRLYYCFPTDADVSVTKVRLAAEEMYKIARGRA